MGSPEASAVSGPGVAETKAICLLSGDQVTLAPWPGSGELLPFIRARKVAPEPSACATHRPDFSPSPPEYANHLPSGDQSGSDVASWSPPTRTDFRLARSMIETWE